MLVQLSVFPSLVAGFEIHSGRFSACDAWERDYCRRFLGEPMTRFIPLNLPPVEFGRVVGLYIATLFVVWQVVNFFVFGVLPVTPVLDNVHNLSHFQDWRLLLEWGSKR
jgi:hypothetical protein